MSVFAEITEINWVKSGFQNRFVNNKYIFITTLFPWKPGKLSIEINVLITLSLKFKVITKKTKCKNSTILIVIVITV